jgi:hypothetical protein
MTTLERIAAELAGAAALILAAFIWWHVHNAGEQKLGAQACIQATTITKQAAASDAAADQTAQAAEISEVLISHDAKLLTLDAGNAGIARGLSNDALRPNGVPHPGSLTCQGAAEPGLPPGESEAQLRLERIQADLTAVLNACDANQVRTEDLATIYNGVRDRAIAAEKKGASQAP